MDIIPQLLTAKVMHSRLFPKKNYFTYSVYYLAVPLPALKIPNWFMVFPEKDLGPQDGTSVEVWARGILAQNGLEDLTLMVVTMPRVFGHVFNPVSFYLCLDRHKKLRAVLCEVHNTFGEQHVYLCLHSDHRPIESHDWLQAEKAFHVSPFLTRSGGYRFRFDLTRQTLGVWITYQNAEGRTQLMTSLIGSFSPLTAQSLIKEFCRHPLVTLKVIFLIHFQALKLWLKSIRYIVKPSPLPTKVTRTKN